MPNPPVSTCFEALDYYMNYYMKGAITGVDVKTVGERQGHDTVQTTLELYGHVTP
jgi:hypothetical protein